MLGKLMKYEFKSTGRIYLPLFGALLLIAIINKIFIALNLSVPMIIGSTLSGFMVGAICVMTLILTIQRFSRNLLKSEGYLMFTLPVNVDGLIWSKLIVASIWTVVSVIVVFLAVWFMAATGNNYNEMMAALQSLLTDFAHLGAKGMFIVIECIILAIVMLFAGILMLYVCVALSLLVNKHRVGFAFLMYIAITVIGQIIFGIIATSIEPSSLSMFYGSLSSIGQVQAMLGTVFVATVIPGVIFYVVTRLMLKYKLNLE